MGVTLRSVIIGLVLIPLNAMWLILSEIMWYSGEPTTLSLFYNVIFILTLLTIGNGLIKRWRPGWALDAGELLVVYVMLCIASALAGHDMLQILVPIMSHMDRFEPIERRYGEIMEHIPEWLAVTDARALQSAYIGQESIFDRANYEPWLAPLFWWSLFVFALLAVMGGINLFFRKQWTENEKLSYPILQVPTMLTTQAKDLIYSRGFWIGFGIAAFIDLMNGLNALNPMLPAIPIVHVMNLQQFFPEPPWNAIGPAHVSFYPFAIGMSFFMPLDLAFSAWFFFFMWMGVRVFAAHIGMHGMVGFPFVDEQTAGGYYAIAFMALWISRGHLKRLLWMLLGKEVEDVTADDQREARIGLLLTAGGAAGLFYFCWAAGMSAWVIILFFVLYFMTAFSITRMRAELGPPSHDLHNIGPDKQITRFFDVNWMRRRNPVDIAMFGFLSAFTRAYRSHPMPHGMEALRIAQRRNMSSMRMMGAMGVATVAGTICAFFAMLWVFNRYGASAQVLGPGEFFGREAWDHIHILFTAPPRHQTANLTAVLIGLVVCLGLAVLRLNLTWWVFHPVGFAISGSWSMQQLWLCIFIGWLIKLLLLKYGGNKAYRYAVPFFIGLILGDFMVGSLWNIYGIVMETQVYHFWPY